MTFRGHIMVGITTYFVAVVPIVVWILYRQNWIYKELWYYWWELLICFGLCLIGAMFPDVDIKSKSQRIIYSILIPIDLILILFTYYRAAAILGFFAIIPNTFKHRGVTHSPLAALILPSPLLIVPALADGRLEYQQMGVSYYIATMFGYMSHLIADRKRRDR